MCRQDADLASWFDHHCAVQAVIRAQLRTVVAPEGLREQILSEYKAKVLTVWWRRPVVLATVASLALLISVGSLWLNLPRQGEQDVSFSAYRNRMVRTVVRDYGSAMDLETNNVAQIRAYLAQQQAPADYVLPRNLEQTETVGCGALSWQGKPVAMICFRTGKPLPAGAKSDLFLFVIDQQDVIDPPQISATILTNVSSLITATWQQGGKIYLLAGFDEAEVKQRM